MPNTFTNLERDSYLALDVVSRELTGLILACSRDSSADQLAIGEVARAPEAAEPGDPVAFTPSMTIPAATEETIGSIPVEITDQEYLDFTWSGDEEYSLNKTGPGVLTIQQQQIAKRMRRLIRRIELAGTTLAYQRSSRAYGTAGTAPFATAGDWSDLAQVKKILKDNGAPISDLQLVLNTSASANIEGKQAQVQMTQDVPLLRQGILDRRLDFDFRESGQIVQHIKGTGTNYVVNNGNIAVGSKVLSMDGGSGTIIVGDVLTNSQSGRDANKYIVHAALSGGDLAVADPGLRAAWDDGDTLAVGGSYAANLAFAREAIMLATRVPKFPAKGDLAKEVMTVTDPRTGLSFMIRYYPGIGMGVYRMFISWGWAVIKGDWIATLLG